jgi:hypothetical protein
VDSGFFREGIFFNSDPHAVTFQHGYFKELASVLTAFNKSEVKTDAATSALELLNSTPVLVIPSGGLYGYENSGFFKATLDQYVKEGGTLVVFAQQHGYEFGILPTPPDPVTGEARPLTAYGWTEDQSCYTNAVYLDTYHQVLSGLSAATVTANVDGYFTSYPDTAVILLRRSVNGQPALLLYEYGLGRCYSFSCMV